MLDDRQTKSLDAMWDELRFVSEAPLKKSILSSRSTPILDARCESCRDGATTQIDRAAAVDYRKRLGRGLSRSKCKPLLISQLSLGGVRFPLPSKLNCVYFTPGFASKGCPIRRRSVCWSLACWLRRHSFIEPSRRHRGRRLHRSTIGNWRRV